MPKTALKSKQVQILIPIDLYNLILADARNIGESNSTTIRTRLRERYEQITSNKRKEDNERKLCNTTSG